MLHHFHCSYVAPFFFIVDKLDDAGVPLHNGCCSSETPSGQGWECAGLVIPRKGALSSETKQKN